MGTSGSVGCDLFSVEDKILKASSVTTIATRLYLEIPLGYFGRIYPRSSLTRYYLIDVGGGVIDYNFRVWLLIVVIIFNHSKEDYEVAVGDRVAQIIFQKKEEVNFVKCVELSKTERGLGGFDSTSI